jgi:acetyl-CoA carboxylase carboxyl transferase subunit alpha
MESPAYVLEFEKPLRELSRQLDELRQRSIETNVDLAAEVGEMERKIEATQREIYTNLTPWQRVQIARHPKRPYALDYIQAICEDFQELHGDRQYKDDRAIIGGTAFFNGDAVMIVAQQKGRDTEGTHRTQLRHAAARGLPQGAPSHAARGEIHLPVLTFIDTPGAFPGIESEARHVSEAIAVNLREMAMLRTPTISVVIGEGGSGGALGIGVTDRVLILENSYYSVISPEGCAAILWKDGSAAPKAAEALKVSADHLEKLGVVDEVIPEPPGGAHHDPELAAQALQYALQKHLNDLRALDLDRLLDNRYERFRHLGVFEEAGVVRS